MNAPVLHRYARAETVDHALVLLGGNPAAAPIAGGTDLLPLTRARLRDVSCVVDLGRLPLTQVSLKRGELTLGALVTMSQAAADPRVRQSAPLLALALQAGASAQVRHRATLGGNLLQAPRCPWFRTGAPGCNRRMTGSGCEAQAADSREGERWLAILGASDACAAASTSDLAVALCALEAHLDIVKKDGEQARPLRQLWSEGTGDTPPGASVLPAGSLIRSIRIPLGEGDVDIDVGDAEGDKLATSGARGSTLTRFAYEKVRDRASFEFAVVSVAVALTVVDGRIERVRLAAGGVAPVPWRLAQVEARLIGRPATSHSFVEASACAADGAKPFEGNAFKARLLPRVIVRALESAMESA